MGVAKRPDGPVRQATRLFSRPSAISRQLFVVTALIWLVSGYPTLARSGGEFTLTSLTQWTASVIAGQFALFSVLLVAKKTVLRTRFSRRHPAVAVWILLVGVVGGFIVAHATGSALGARESLFVIAGEGIPFAVVVVVLVGGALEAFRMYRQRLQKLRQRDSDLRNQTDNTVRALSADVEAAKQLVQTVQREAHQAIDKGGQSGAAALRELSRTLVRPRSHDLAATPMVTEGPTPSVPAPRWPQVLEQVSTSPLVAPVFTSTLVTLLGFRLSVQAPATIPSGPSDQPVSVSVDWESFLLSIVALAAIFVVTLVVSLVARRLMRRALLVASPSVRVTSSAVLVVAVPVVSLLILAAIYRAIGVFSAEISQPGVVAGFFLVFVAVSVVAALFRAVTLASEDVLNQLVALTSQGNRKLVTLQQKAWSTRQHLAFALHGPVRTALLAAAHDVSQLGAPITVREKEKWFQVVEAACAQVVDGEVGARAPADLRALGELWRGRCEVSVRADVATSTLLEVNGLLARVVYQIVDEALANAISHGDARRVEVNLVAKQDVVELTVNSDGRGPGDGASRGLGSTLFDQLCLSWNIGVHGEGVRFSAVVPIPAMA